MVVATIDWVAVFVTVAEFLLIEVVVVVVFVTKQAITTVWRRTFVVTLLRTLMIDFVTFALVSILLGAQSRQQNYYSLVLLTRKLVVAFTIFS